jgi:nucleoside-diphosphate-sugar epimerase
LVTGAAGFIGACLADRLVTEGVRATLVVRPGSDRWRLTKIETEAEIREVDLRDGPAVRRLVAAAKADWVFHLGAHGAYSWQTDPDAIFAVNLSGTRQLAQAALERGVEAFVHAGSSSEYGFKSSAPSEDDAPEPNSWYAVSKTAATLSIQYLARQHDQRLVTLRLSSVYGPWEDPRRLVPTLLSHGLRDRFPRLVSPEISRDFVYVDDVCDAFLAAAAAKRLPHQIYNVGSGRQTTVGELVEIVRRQLSITGEPEWGGYATRIWDTKTWVSDPRRIGMDLGWTARTELAQGLAATTAWLQQQPEVGSRYGPRQPDRQRDDGTHRPP